MDENGEQEGEKNKVSLLERDGAKAKTQQMGLWATAARFNVSQALVSDGLGTGRRSESRAQTLCTCGVWQAHTGTG